MHVPSRHAMSLVAALLALAACGGSGSDPQPECSVASDCGADTECRTFACNSGSCATVDVAAGTVLATQTAGDCQEARCDGGGGVTSAALDSDLPADDGSDCTSELCSGGNPVHPALDVDTACATGGGNVCDGAGACVACNAPSQCPGGPDTECQTKTCDANVCGLAFASPGFVVSTQTAGDCKENRCDGAGVVVPVAFASDLPADDGNACTGESCSGSAPVHPALDLDTPCAQGGGSFCDGAGSCVECNAPTQCPGGPDSECQTKTCDANQCGLAFTGAGTAVSAQTTGDCQEAQCNGAGSVVTVALTTDVPADDGNQCTGEACSGSTPVHPPLPPDTTCNQNGGSYCDTAGACVECNTAIQCPGADTECQTRRCAANLCGFSYADAGTLVAAQMPGDCQMDVCDGSGGVSPTPDDTDVPPDDGLQCTSDSCSSGAPVHPPVAPNTTCTENGGAYCDAAGACVACNTDAQCPGITDECQAPRCSGSACGTLYAPAGTVCLVSGVCDGAGVCNTPPTVVATGPSDGAIAILPTSIAVTFSTSMIPASLTAQTAFGACSGSIQLSLDNFATCWPFASAAPVMTGGNIVATLQPAPGLLVNRVYKLRVTTAATSAVGLPLASTWTTAIGFMTQVAGVLNESGDPLEADWCNLQFPSSTSTPFGVATQTLFGQVFEFGVTPTNGGQFTAQVGYGPPTANPQYEPGWTWVPAPFNVQVGNNDEYQATLTVPVPGSYRYTFRFSRDAGVSWTYCDLNGAGTNVGTDFDLALGVLTVTP